MHNAPAAPLLPPPAPFAPVRPAPHRMPRPIEVDDTGFVTWATTIRFAGDNRATVIPAVAS